MSESEIQNAYLPDEIIKEILSRLPVKSLLQFRSVSKHWKCVIANTDFIKSHLKHALSSSTQHRILIPSSPLLSLSYNLSPNNIYESTEIHCPFLNPKAHTKIMGSCNGLVCLMDDTRDMIIYNPSTRRHFKPFQLAQQALYFSNRVEFVYGFGCGCGSNPNDMRMFRFPRFSRDFKYNKFKEHDKITTSSSSYDFIDTVGTFLNGVLHWLAHRSGNNDDYRLIASFNVSEETFLDICLPNQDSRLPCYVLGVLHGCLSGLCNAICYTEVEVWLMEEYGVVDSWKIFVKIPLYTGIENISYMRHLRSLNDDEILLEINLQSFVIYDAKKKMFRHVTSANELILFGDAVVYVETLLSPEVLCVMH
ncbi:unnamed protein product [Lactuca saligna]|uniref:F-box domain-containing protein n=1 Tax=Lactuca saligna TaxID=75948 RepID=A0AA36A1J7_LACSI|nr:unnamed protein product [Lactuca saligna]